MSSSGNKTFYEPKVTNIYIATWPELDIGIDNKIDAIVASRTNCDSHHCNSCLL